MPRGWSLTLFGALAALLAAVFAPPAVAQVGVVGTPLAVCVARAVPRQSAATMFTDAAHFDCAMRQSAFGPGDYWLRSAPIPRGAAGEARRVRFASVWQDRVTLYAQYADGAVFRATLDGHAVSHRLQLGAVLEQPLPVRQSGVVRLLWHVEGSANLRGILLGATLATSAESAESNLALGAIYAAFLGLALALLVYNAALWVALRHRFQLAYCAMLVTLALYAVSSSGALAWLVPTLANNDRLRINYLTLGLSAASALVFARTFFERRVFAGLLAPVVATTVAVLVGAAMFYAGLAPRWIGLFDRIYAGSFVALFGVVVGVLWRAWRLRSNYLWLFAIAWSVPVGFAVVRTASNFHLLPWSFWIDNSTILAMAVEALISSIAIAYRIRLLSRERDEAREQEFAARLLADVDPLTGLFNRRAFLREAIGRAGAQQLLVIDIDHFKQVNETLGHDGGDEVLRRVARSLRALAPAQALVARLGGEEFAILTGAAAALPPALVLDEVRAARMPFDLPVTVSVGVSEGPLASEADWNRLYRASDRALFEAKAAGRDRVRHALSRAA